MLSDITNDLLTRADQMEGIIAGMGDNLTGDDLKFVENLKSMMEGMYCLDYLV